MTMRRKITQDGRISIGGDARGLSLAEKVTVSGSVRGILLSPYRPGDETRSGYRVLSWDASGRIALPLQFRQQAGLAAGDEADVLFREDGSILLVAARDTCTLCGQLSPDMLRLPNGRLVCPRCRRILGRGGDDE